MQFFIHCNFFWQEYKFTYLLTYFLTYLLTVFNIMFFDGNFSLFQLVWLHLKIVQQFRCIRLCIQSNNPYSKFSLFQLLWFCFKLYNNLCMLDCVFCLIFCCKFSQLQLILYVILFQNSTGDCIYWLQCYLFCGKFFLLTILYYDPVIQIAF